VIAIIAAMQEELAAVVSLAQIERTIEIAKRQFYVGRLGNQPVVMVVSRIGKVAAATTATILLERFAVTQLLFTGLAGAVSSSLNIGDIVIATAALQHDLDARPLFPQFEVPNLAQAEFVCDLKLSNRLANAARAFANSPPAPLRALGITAPTVHRGLVISGDQFIGTPTAVDQLRSLVPTALAVEMEGAAVAQVCFERDIPFVLLRVISDSANHDAQFDFGVFLREACGVYAGGLVMSFLLQS
jgi:adenosylhomocysteine nucleosidase